MRKYIISYTVRTILNNVWDGFIPIDPEKIAKAFDIKVIDDANLSHNGKSISGEYLETKKGCIIKYNASESTLSQRFIIAHELGHFALRHGSAMRDTHDSFSSGNRDRKEVEANKFATELLLPRVLVEHQITEKNNNTINKLAAVFNVSEAAVEYRLESLGWG